MNGSWSWLNALIGSVINKTIYTCGTATLQIYDAYNQHRFKYFGEASVVSILQAFITIVHPVSLYTRLVSISSEALEHLVYASLVYLLVCLIIYSVISRSKTLRSTRLPWLSMKKRILFVTSHPDDECMFFGPLIYTLTAYTDCIVYILCLSNGNYENLSYKRREELWSACQNLGIPEANIILVNATNLPDDPNVEWRTETVANFMLHTVETLGIQALVTFDREGVSQHPNHCAVYYAAASLCLTNLLPKDCKLYALDSINIVRKYLSIFDIMCTCVMSKYWCLLNWQQAAVVRNAMRQHKTQMKWFRCLYIFCSRYMFINSIREVNLADIELEMQIQEP
uniref:N-acetylglucosaminyl-phosphatidylinositol de-N-acetylase n=1 Tax=Glossina morsitans morsitans TaxID=37546 RepID=A0A1B0G7Y8_GLOMM